ncbi:MAG: alpha/beta fold hydrolase [Flammeovirgaceae bacterium]
MRKLIKYGKIILIILILVSCAGMALLYSVDKADENKMVQQLADKGITVTLHELAVPEGNVRVARAGNPLGKKLVLIHGSPGNWTAWSNILSDQRILDAFDVVAIDRPGYGKTTIPAQRELERQGAVVLHVVNQLWGTEPYVVVGHSYGGAVAEAVMLHPQSRVSGGVWVAASLSPKFQGPKWYNRLGKAPVVNWLLPERWKSSNVEMMGLQEGLGENEAKLGDISVPVVMIHGKKDILVPFKTVEYIQQHVPQQFITYELNDTLNHFIPWSNPDLISDSILRFK